MNDFPVGEKPQIGLRVWTQEGLKSHGLNKTDVLAETGGTIIFEDKEADRYAIEWDAGQVTVHSVCDFAQELVCIGRHRTLDEYVLKPESDDS